MNKEQQELLGEAYENYLDITDRKWMNSDIGDLDDMIYDGYLFIDGDDIRVLKLEEFIYIIKEVAEFAEKWGLKIDERELILEERSFIANSNHNEVSQNIKMFTSIDGDHTLHKHLDEIKIPTKLITITYKDKTIESYE
jgi:hypothetical protein